MNSLDQGPGTIDTMLRSKLPALGIDLGGTKLAAAVVSDCRLASEVKQVPTPGGRNEIIEAIIDLIEYFRKQQLLAGVGIATCGIVNPHTGQVVGATGNLPGWEGTAIKSIIEGRTMLPVHVENDANAAAYGECRAAGLANKTCTVTVTLGTGIGVGIVINGSLYRGSHFTSQGGHIKVALDHQRLCTCGLWDCWEAYGCGRGLVATGQALLVGITEQQSELARPGLTLTTQAIFDAAGRKDIVAQKIVHSWHEHICAGLVSLAHTLDPECFLVTGGLSPFVNYELLTELLADRTLPSFAQAVCIQRSSLGTAAGMVGSAQLVLDSLTTH